MRAFVSAFVTSAFIIPVQAYAWNSHGHMAVADVAWAHMTPAAQQRAGELLKQNPDYDKWVAEAKSGDEARTAFIKASTWPDEIKQTKGYHNDGYTPSDPHAGDISDYSDKLMHKGWHFIDIPYSPDGTPTEPPFATNAVTQILKAEAILASDSASDGSKSYSLSWLLHLVGDMHQPLHATSRFTKDFPKGDTGGNDVKACSDTRNACGDRDELHAFWDEVTGTSKSISSVDSYVRDLKLADNAKVSIQDPMQWAEESEKLAETYVYAPPIGLTNETYRLTEKYRDDAKSVASSQIELAGERLAAALNEELK